MADNGTRSDIDDGFSSDYHDLSDASIDTLERALGTARQEAAWDPAAWEWLTQRITELRTEFHNRPHGGHVIAMDDNYPKGSAPFFQVWCHCEKWHSRIHGNGAAALAEGDQHLAKGRR